MARMRTTEILTGLATHKFFIAAEPGHFAFLAASGVRDTQNATFAMAIVVTWAFRCQNSDNTHICAASACGCQQSNQNAREVPRRYMHGESQTVVAL